MDGASRQSFGQSFVFSLIGALLFAIFLYAMVHGLFPAEKVRWKQFAEVQSNGEVAFLNLDEFEWYIGVDSTKQALQDIRDRNAAIAEAQARLRADLRGLSKSVADQAQVGNIEVMVSGRHFVEAYEALNKVASSLSKDARDLLNLAGMGDRLFDLDRLVRNQYAALETLFPPVTQLFFWTSPRYVVFEVLFWSLFGVLTNLLVNSAEHLRKGDFVPRERFVAYTKLVYGPILATVMVLAIIFGFFDLGPYSTRVWTLPLIAFIFGYAARRTARLFDKLQDKVFGAAEKSIEEGPQRIADERANALTRLKDVVRPTTFAQIEDQAKHIAAEHIAIVASTNEAKT
jgi:hypothetical protein